MSSDAHQPAIAPASAGAAALAFVICFAALLAVAHDSYLIRPAGDDFPEINQILRGNQLGPAVFFSSSHSSQVYRPFKSLAIWLCGRVAPAHPLWAIRVAHLLALASFAAAVLLWTRTLQLGIAGTWTTAALASL